MANGAVAEVEVGETLVVGQVALTVEQKSGRKVRLRIVAPREMKISHEVAEPGASRMSAEKSA